MLYGVFDCEAVSPNPHAVLGSTHGTNRVDNDDDDLSLFLGQPPGTTCGQLTAVFVAFNPQR